MFSSDRFKKVEKVISKFFFFNEGIHHSEESRGIRETNNDDGGKDVRILSSSSSDDGEDGDDNDDNDGSGGDDDNNEGNNSADRGTYSLEGHMQMLSLTSGQHYDVTYVYDYRPQLERCTSTRSVYLLTAEMIMMILCFIIIQCENNYISMYL